MGGKKRGARRPNLSISSATRTPDAICRILKPNYFFLFKMPFWFELDFYFFKFFFRHISYFQINVCSVCFRKPETKKTKQKKTQLSVGALIADAVVSRTHSRQTLLPPLFLFCFLNRDVGRSASLTVKVPSADNREVPRMKSSDLSFVVQSNGAALVLGSE